MKIFRSKSELYEINKFKIKVLKYMLSPIKQQYDSTDIPNYQRNIHQLKELADAVRESPILKDNEWFIKYFNEEVDYLNNKFEEIKDNYSIESLFVVFNDRIKQLKQEKDNE
jgi:hypothetical protein